MVSDEVIEAEFKAFLEGEGESSKEAAIKFFEERLSLDECGERDGVMSKTMAYAWQRASAMMADKDWPGKVKLNKEGCEQLDLLIAECHRRSRKRSRAHGSLIPDAKSDTTTREASSVSNGIPAFKRTT